MSVNLHNTVTRLDAGNIAWSCGNDTFKTDRVVEDDEDRPDVRNDPIGMISSDLGILGIKVTGVGVKSSQDERDAPFHEDVQIHSVHILLGNKVENRFDLGVAAFSLVGGTRVVAVNEKTCRKRNQSDGDC